MRREDEAATFLSFFARRSPVVCPSFSRPSLVVVSLFFRHFTVILPPSFHPRSPLSGGVTVSAAATTRDADTRLVRPHTRSRAS